MKKIFLIAFIILIQLQANAFEDYVILSENPVNTAYSKDDNIAVIAPFYTIYNEKNTLILKSKKEGKTSVVIETDEKNFLLDVEVKKDETKISEQEGLSIFVLDRGDNGPIHN